MDARVLPAEIEFQKVFFKVVFNEMADACSSKKVGAVIRRTKVRPRQGQRAIV
jgi:hypothetical protein